MSDYIKNAIFEHIHSLVDVDKRQVEPTREAMFALAIAYAEDGHNPEDLMFGHLPQRWWEVFHVDMMRVFAGLMKPDDFFEKYRAHYYDLAGRLRDDLSDQIWNTAVDLLDIKPVDLYEEYGVKRSDF